MLIRNAQAGHTKHSKIIPLRTLFKPLSGDFVRRSVAKLEKNEDLGDLRKTCNKKNSNLTIMEQLLVDEDNLPDISSCNDTLIRLNTL